jgi:DNA-binding transcriptional ArsR family regulator
MTAARVAKTTASPDRSPITVNDRVNVNDVGDVVLENVLQLRALGDPDRLAVFTRLQREGPATVEDLARALGRSHDSIAASLEPLAMAGLVERDGTRWRALGRGLFLQLPENDLEAVAAARHLSTVMLLAVEHLPRQWVEQVEPALDDSWAGAAGLLNVRLALTVDELNQVQQELERVLEPYLTRTATSRPDDTRQVRLLAYFLPEASG